jgi:hypothetical protein
VPPAASTSTAQNAAPAPATKPPAVDFTDAQPIVVDRETPSGYTFVVFLRNDDPAPTKVDFSATLQKSNGDTGGTPLGLALRVPAP